MFAKTKDKLKNSECLRPIMKATAIPGIQSIFEKQQICRFTHTDVKHTDVRAAKVSKKLSSLIEKRFEEFEKYITQNPPKNDKNVFDKALMKKLSNETSFEYYQYNIFPIKRKNTLEMKIKKRFVKEEKDVFRIGEIVKIVSGDCEGQIGEIAQVFHERNTVIVKNANPNKLKGESEIDSVEVPIDYECVRHYRIRIMSLKLKSYNFLKNKTKDLEEAVAKYLNSCEYCTEVRVVHKSFESKAIIVMIRKTRENCFIKDHEGFKKLKSEIQEEPVLEIKDEETRVLSEEIVIDMDQTVEAEVIKVPIKHLRPNCYVICMLDSHFGKKGSVVEVNLDEIRVKFDGEENIYGPFPSVYFKKYIADQKEIIDTELKTKSVRVIKLSANDNLHITKVPFYNLENKKNLLTEYFVEKDVNDYDERYTTTLKVAQKKTWKGHAEL